MLSVLVCTKIKNLTLLSLPMLQLDEEIRVVSLRIEQERQTQSTIYVLYHGIYLIVPGSIIFCVMLQFPNATC